MGACSPLIYRASQPDTLDFAGAWLDPRNWTSGHYEDAHKAAPPVGGPLRFFLTGCALFIRNDAVRKVGLLDERFFLYWEDVDFCLRMSEAGFALKVVPSASVLHRVFGSSSQNTSLPHYYDLRNRFLMWRKHSVRREAGRVRREMLRSAVSRFSATRPGAIDDLPLALAKGLVDGLAGRFGASRTGFQRCGRRSYCRRSGSSQASTE